VADAAAAPAAVPTVPAAAIDTAAPLQAQLQAPSPVQPHTPAPAALGDGDLPSNLPDYLSQVERDIILRALTQTQFNRTQAASLLGISVRQLRYQMQKLDIHAPEP
jgi:two-component system response regulator PilR (NtrC family)